VELAAELRRVADQQDARALGGEEALGRLEDLLVDARSLVDDEQQMVGVVALEALGLVGRLADREPLLAELQLRRRRLGEPDGVRLEARG
jgi:hypothetical protein